MGSTSTDEPREIVVVGSAVVEVPRAFFVERVRNIEQFRANGPTLQVGEFGAAPTVGDLLRLELPRIEVDSLRLCRVGACKVQMSAEAIEQVRTEVQWTRPHYPGQAMAIYRRMLADYVRAYVEGGNATLVEYYDQQLPVPLRQEFEAVLARWPFMASRFPVLNRHLVSFPALDRSAVEDVFYWSLDSFGGFKPVVSVTHLSLHHPAQSSLIDTVMASKQIYASHYVDASLGLTMLVDRQTREPSVHLLYLNRSRSGFFKRRVFGGLARSFARRRLRNATEDYLRRTKRRVEAAFSAGER